MNNIATIFTTIRINVIPFIILSLIFIILSIILIILTVKKQKITNKTEHKNHNEINVISLLPFVCVLFVSIAFTTTTIIGCCRGFAHGMKSLDIDIPQMFNSIKLSPSEDTLPENLDDSIIIYYRFGCKDCEAIYDDISRFTDQMDNTYYVCIDSEQGKKLLKEFPVEEVPSAIYVRKNKNDKSLMYTRKTLYKENDKKEVIFNEDEFERLILLREREQEGY